MTEKYINSVLRSSKWTAHRESGTGKYLYTSVYSSYWGEDLGWSVQFCSQTLSHTQVAFLHYKKQSTE